VELIEAPVGGVFHQPRANVHAGDAAAGKKIASPDTIFTTPKMNTSLGATTDSKISITISSYRRLRLAIGRPGDFNPTSAEVKHSPPFFLIAPEARPIYNSLSSLD
jgi:hypothetical protein